MSKRISFLIVTWNSWRDLKRCVESILPNLESDDELVVIDNGSSDDTVEKIEQSFGERVRLHCNEVNLGLPPAVNQGVAQTLGDYIMLLDVDTEIQSDAPALLFEYMQQHPEAALIAPRILTPEGKDEGTARNLPSVTSGLFGRQSALTRLLPNNPFSRHYMALAQRSNSEPFLVEQVSAACMFFRRELIEQAGPWDETYRCYWVDTDWCARLRQLGKKVYCVPQAHVTHFENNRAGKKKSAWRIWHFHTGAFRLYRKYYTWGWFDLRIPLVGILLLSRALVMLLFNHFLSDKGENPSNKQPRSA